MTSYYDSKRKMAIVEEIRRWIESVLSKPSAHFNGLPPCPYAKAAWVNNDVKVAFGNQHEVLNFCNEWKNEEASLVIVVMEKEADGLAEWCEEQNKVLASEDLTLMPFIPGDTIDTGQPEEEMENWEPLVEEEYSMVFVQGLIELETASAHLMSKGYYKNCTSQFMSYVKERSERVKYARQEEDVKEVNEEEANEEEANEDAPKEALIYGKEEEAGFVRKHSRQAEED